jgi:topoisomerase IV subunit B
MSQQDYSQIKYDEDNIKTLEWQEHIRLRPGMYIGKLGDGASPDDGIYVLLKEVIDNSIDEYVMGHGKQIEIAIEDGVVTVRDYGRGIPLGKVVDVVSKINTGGKYDSKAFKKSVGLNGVGTKAVNALSEYFKVASMREGEVKAAEFSMGKITKDHKQVKTNDANGTIFTFRPDPSVFKGYRYRQEFVESQLWNYAYLNAGLKMIYNGKSLVSKNGLRDLLERKIGEESIEYPIIHMKDEDIEIAMTHGKHYGEHYHSFVNGQNTTQGGTHLQAFREAIVETIRGFYNKKYESQDIRTSIIAAVSVRIEEPVFESQTKTKLGSQAIAPEGLSIRKFVGDFIQKTLDDFLHKNKETAEALRKRIEQN